MRHLTEQLHEFLPGDFTEQAQWLTDVSQHVSGLAGIVFPDYIEVYGQSDYEIAIQALSEMTLYSTAEFAIRPFIQHYPEQTIQQLLIWAKDDNEHRRRLASEGCRPRLPWAMALPKFKQDPTPILPILETLKADPSDYVRKSVGNNLNDIAKDHPDVVIQFSQRNIGQTHKPTGSSNTVAVPY